MSTLKLFEETNNLNFTLLSDITTEIATRFGVPVREGGSITKTVNGKERVLDRAYTPSRRTFVIDKKGKLFAMDHLSPIVIPDRSHAIAENMNDALVFPICRSVAAVNIEVLDQKT